MGARARVCQKGGAGAGNQEEQGLFKANAGGGGGGEEEEEEELTLCRGGSSLKFVTIKFNVLHYASTREEGGRKRERSKERFRTDRARLRESLLRITTL